MPFVFCCLKYIYFRVVFDSISGNTRISYTDFAVAGGNAYRTLKVEEVSDSFALVHLSHIPVTTYTCKMAEKQRSAKMCIIAYHRIEQH